MTHEQEIAANYEAFQQLLPSIGKENTGKFALMRNKEIVKIFDSAADAMIFADAEFKDDLWSIQQILVRMIDLGWFSHAMRYGTI